MSHHEMVNRMAQDCRRDLQLTKHQAPVVSILQRIEDDNKALNAAFHPRILTLQ